MQLSSIVPWGRSLAEYKAMFDLSITDLERRILGCGDGPASFNAELTGQGGEVVSVDPIYQFTRQEIHSRIQRVYPGVVAELARNAEQYHWSSFRDPGHVGSVRMSAMNRFLSDYDSGLKDGRYIEASLPELPMFDNEFELAVVSHLLFLYSEQIDAIQHLNSLKELCRVAGEVRVFPLVDLKGKLSSHLRPVMEELYAQGYHVERVKVPYRFQKGADEMLRVVSKKRPSRKSHGSESLEPESKADA
ncbi:SAM-dependent methyltransferase [Spongiibacter sp. KMU-158]|uniref:SAM-dependent methyltransferase n=1 Tax=Spongiibacter pelagi TaxID=2760804 RepID=A0A927GVR8_9GAMM|nr:SAM-dependent methyltransferase [Spongiibacter pelagi]MBD2858695.1 SAM-dependent methyltransferase [Spongiibacter pelagi]